MEIRGRKSNTVKVKNSNLDYLSNIKEGASEAPTTASEIEKANEKLGKGYLTFSQIERKYYNREYARAKRSTSLKAILRKEICDNYSSIKKDDLNNLFDYFDKLVIKVKKYLNDCKSEGADFLAFAKEVDKIGAGKYDKISDFYFEHIKGPLSNGSCIVDPCKGQVDEQRGNFKKLQKKPLILNKRNYHRDKLIICALVMCRTVEVLSALYCAEDAISNLNKEKEKYNGLILEYTTNKLLKYKKNFEIWYTQKATEKDLQKCKGLLSDTFLWKKSPGIIIGKVEKCKTMPEFEALIKTWGMNRNDLKNKKIFGNAVK